MSAINEMALLTRELLKEPDPVVFAQTNRVFHVIPGLHYLPEFISRKEEKELMLHIDSQPWNTSLSRRTQHYGYRYDYSIKSLDRRVVNSIPEWCQFLIDRLLDAHVLFERPDQMIINEYMPGQGISPHIDSIDAFQDGIASVSLGSPVAMDFLCISDRKQVLLASRSVVSMHGDARYLWKHGIAARKRDNKVLRGRRVSLTFRTVKT